MADYGVRYFGRLASADGHVYQCRLLKKDYSGDADKVVLTDSPAKVMWGKKGSDVYAPFLASHAEIKNWRLADGSGTLSDLIGAKRLDFRLEILRAETHAEIDNDEGVLYWYGQVLADVYQDSTLADPHEVDVQAVDGLGTLKELPYYDTTTDPGERLPYEGTESLLTIAIRALGKLGYALPVRSALAWRPAGETGDPLALLEVDNLAFYDPDGKAMTCYEVLEEIARRCGARWCQWCEGDDGAAWWLVSRELMDGDTYTVYQYTDDGTADGTTAAGASVDAEAAVRQKGDRTYRPAFGAVSVLHDHGVVPPLIDEGAFEDVSETGVLRILGRNYVTVRLAYESEEWAYTGDAEASQIAADTGVMTRRGTYVPVARPNYAHRVAGRFHGSITDPATVKTFVVEQGGFHPDTGSLSGPNYAERTADAAVHEGQFLAFKGNVVVNAIPAERSGYPQTYFELSFLGDDTFRYYMRRDGTWSIGLDDDERAIPMTEEGAEWADIGIQPNSPFAFQFTTAALPTDGTNLKLRLYGTSDSGNHLANDLDFTSVDWDDVAVLIVNSEGEALGATLTEVFTTDSDGMPLPDPERVEVKVRLGEGPPQDLPTRLLWDGAEIEDGTWRSALLTSDRALDLLHAETILRSQSKPLQNRQETYRNLSASPIAPIETDGVFHTLQYLGRDLYHDEVEVETIEVDWDGALSFVSESAGSGDPGTFSGGGSGGVGTAAPAATPPVITTHGDLIAGDEEGVADRLPVGTDGQQLVADSEADLGVAWKDAPDVPSGDEAAATVGRATIEDGNDSVTVTPGVDFHEDSIQATPYGLPEDLWAVDDADGTTFDIVMASTATRDNHFNWAVHPGLPAPLNLEATPGDEEVELTWDAVTGADGYEVSWWETATPETVLGTEDGVTSPHTVDGLTNDTEYTFAVRAYRET